MRARWPGQSWDGRRARTIVRRRPAVDCNSVTSPSPEPSWAMLTRTYFVPCRGCPRFTCHGPRWLPSSRVACLVVRIGTVDSYFASLLDSGLPFDAWVAALTWIALFVTNHLIARASRAANDSQAFVAVEDWSALRRGFQPKFVLAQILFAGIVFAAGLFLGGAAFVFLAGGLIVAITLILSLNFQSFRSARAMAQPNAATGALTFSTALALRQGAYRLGGAALGCLIIGLALAHLALIGGALILSAAALGYLRRARNVRAKP
jgi:hypothetical protein